MTSRCGEGVGDSDETLVIEGSRKRTRRQLLEGVVPKEMLRNVDFIFFGGVVGKKKGQDGAPKFILCFPVLDWISNGLGTRKQDVPFPFDNFHVMMWTKMR